MIRSSNFRAALSRLHYPHWVALAILGGLIIRIALAISDDVITNDASAYLRSGESLWSGEGFRRDGHPELHFPPLYPAVLGGLARLLGDPQRAMVMANLIAGTLLLLPIASLTRRLAGDRAAIAGVWLAAMAPGLTDVPVTSGSGNEVVFLLLALIGIRLALVAHDRSGWARHLAAAGAGLGIGGAYLTRPEGVLYMAVVVGVLALPVVIRRSRDIRGRVTALACAVAGLLVCVVPYMSYLHDNTGAWELTAKTNDASIASWQAVAEHDREARDAIIYKLDDDGISFVATRSTLPALARDDPSGYLGIVGTNVERLFEDLAVPVNREHVNLGWSLLPLPLTLLAAWGAWRLRRRPGVALLVAALLIPTATAVAFFVQARYLIPATAFACALAGMALAQLRGPRLVVASCITAILLLLSLIAAADGSDGFLNRREPVEHRLAGQWLAANTAPDARIMTRSMITEYYSERRAVAVPYADPAAVLAYARHHGVDYIVADEYAFADLRPQLLPWIEEKSPPGYVAVYRLKHANRQLIVFKAVEPSDQETPDPPGIGFMGDG